MAKVKLVNGPEHEMWEFFCPGCGHRHVYYTKNPGVTEQDKSHVWQFNGDLNSPTFTPSLLNRWGTHADPTWQEPEGAQPSAKWSGTCHLYVTKGQIQYLGDCTHHLAGKTVEMQDME